MKPLKGGHHELEQWHQWRWPLAGRGNAFAVRRHRGQRRAARRAHRQAIRHLLPAADDHAGAEAARIGGQETRPRSFHRMGPLHRRPADERGADLRQSRFRLRRRQPAGHHLGPHQEQSQGQGHRRAQFDAAIPQHHQSQREDHQGLHRQGPHRAAGRARVDAGGDPANGRGESVRQGPGAQARCMDRLAQPSGRPRPDDERQIGDHRSLHLGAVHVHGARRQAACTGCSTATTFSAARTLSTWYGPTAKLYEGEPKIVQAFLAALRARDEGDQ